MTDSSKRLSDDELLTAVPRGTKGREASVGLFVLLGLISFVVVIFWMTDPATLRGRYMLVTTVDDAGGVRSGDPVQMQGVNIGRVNGFEMVGQGLIYITLEIEGEWEIPRGSRTEMGEAGLFGGRTMTIVRGDSNEYLAEGDTIPGEGAAAGLMGAVGELSEQDVMAVLAIMKRDFNVDVDRTYLIGQSMGGGGTWHLAIKYSEIWAAIAPMAPAMYTAADPLVAARHLPVMAIHGDADETVDVEGTRRWVAKMAELGMDYRYIEVIGGTHASAGRDNIDDVFAFLNGHRR